MIMYSKSQGLAIFLAFSISIFALFNGDFYKKIETFFPSPTKFLTRAEEKLVLNYYRYISNKEKLGGTSHYDNKIERPKQQRIAFCCSADLDVSVNAIDLLNKLNFTKNELSNPKHHQRISNFQELQESFSHYFQKGAAAEQSMSSLKKFHQIVNHSLDIKTVKQNVGGNAATMAQRAAKEGCKVLLGAAIGKKMKSQFHENVQFAGTLNDIEHEDVHLVLEYAQGDKWNGIESPRANRYYLNHDVYNARLMALEEFEDALYEFKADLVVIGGLQLMEVDTNEERRIKRLKQLSTFLENFYITSIPSHYEFAAVSDFTLFSDITKMVLPWVNSIGLNEQELFILHHYLTTKEHTIMTSSRPTIADVSGQLHDIIKYDDDINDESDTTEKETFPLSQLTRIHFHTLQFHIICQEKNSQWEEPHIPLMQGAYRSTQLACGNSIHNNSASNDPDDLTVSNDDVEILIPRTSSLYRNEEITLDPHTPVQSWEEQDFTCYLTPMLSCKIPNHTAGLGDNISGAGMAYHDKCFNMEKRVQQYVKVLNFND